MVLEYLGLAVEQERLATTLGVVPFIGAPARNIQRLASADIEVFLGKGDMETLAQWVNKGVPVITFVQVRELAHWHGEEFQHAVVINDIEEGALHLLDPELSAETIRSATDEFLLAWGELDYLYAVMNRRV